MGKYKHGLVQDIQEKQEFKEEQIRLKKKHHIEAEEECIVVEKTNMIKFLIRTVENMIRIISSIVVNVFAVIGLTAMVYPAPREEMLTIFQGVIKQMQAYLPVWIK